MHHTTPHRSTQPPIWQTSRKQTYKNDKQLQQTSASISSTNQMPGEANPRGDTLSLACQTASSQQPASILPTPVKSNAKPKPGATNCEKCAKNETKMQQTQAAVAAATYRVCGKQYTERKKKHS